MLIPQPSVINMSSIVDSMKIGLNFGFIVMPKPVLVALGLRANQYGSLSTLLRGRIWFPKKQNDAATI